MTQDGWDDERLVAAFHARFDRPAPRTVAAAVHDAIARTTPARPGPFSRLSAGAAAAAAVIVVVIGAAVIGLGGFGPSGDVVPPAGSPGPTASHQGPTAAVPDLPASVLGLEVVTVTDALAIRDAGPDDRELAVAGWFTPAPPLSCAAPAEEAVSPVQLRCGDEVVWLTERPESLLHVAGASLSASPPVGPALNPDLDDLDVSWQRPLLGIGTNGDSTPLEVVLVGHFDDRRSRFCPDAEKPACRDRFVVDSVARVEGKAPPPSRVSRPAGIAARSPVDEIEAIVAEEAPDSPVLSVVTVVGAHGVPTIEPSLASGQQGLVEQPVLWVVRVLEDGRLATYVVVDGSDAIFEMTEDGDAVPVGGSLGPPASPAPWPPAGSVVIDLTSEVGAGRPPAQVAVVDLSGRLIRVSEQGAMFKDVVISPGGISAYPEPGLPGRVHLIWQGGLCDDEFVVTVAADLRSIAVNVVRDPGVCLPLVTRELVLDFSGTVDVPAIELSETITVTIID